MLQKKKKKKTQRENDSARNIVVLNIIMCHKHAMSMARITEPNSIIKTEIAEFVNIRNQNSTK